MHAKSPKQLAIGNGQGHAEPPSASTNLPLPAIYSNESKASLSSSPSPYLQTPLHLPPIRNYRSQNSLRDMVALSSFGSAGSSSGSLDRVAEDRILGEGKISFAGNGRIVYQTMPTDLSLFELGILINVIHKEKPNYSLLKYQCYWFVYTVISVVEMLWIDELDKKKPGFLSPKEYLPLDHLGTWRRMPIIDLEVDLVHRVISKYHAKRKEEFSLVNILLILIYLFLTWPIWKVTKAVEEGRKLKEEFKNREDDILRREKDILRREEEMRMREEELERKYRILKEG